MNEKLPCGHDRKYYYYHNAVRSCPHRCIKCDDPHRNTRAMQELEPEFIAGYRVIHPDGRPPCARSLN